MPLKFAQDRFSIRRNHVVRNESFHIQLGMETFDLQTGAAAKQSALSDLYRSLAIEYVHRPGHN